MNQAEYFALPLHEQQRLAACNGMADMGNVLGRHTQNASLAQVDALEKRIQALEERLRKLESASS